MSGIYDVQQNCLSAIRLSKVIGESRYTKPYRVTWQLWALGETRELRTDN